MNNKGYTFIELIILLTLSGILLYSAIYVPTSLFQEHTQYTVKSTKINDLALLRTAIAEDINSNVIKPVDETTLIIGKNKYTFSDKVVRGNEENKISLTSYPYSYQIDDNILKIYNKDISLEYSVNSSFMKEGDNIE